MIAHLASTRLSRGEGAWRERRDDEEGVERLLFELLLRPLRQLLHLLGSEKRRGGIIAIGLFSSSAGLLGKVATDQVPYLMTLPLLAGAAAVGDRAPEFRLKDLEGKERSLSDLRQGGAIVLDFGLPVRWHRTLLVGALALGVAVFAVFWGFRWY